MSVLPSFTITKSSKYIDDERTISIRDAATLKDGVNIRITRPGDDVRTVLVGLNLEPDEARALAHDILARIGDPVPGLPVKPLGERVGEYVRHIDDGDVRKIVAPGKGVNLKAYDWATAINASGYESQIYNEPSKVWWEPVQVEIKVKHLWTVVESAPSGLDAK